MTPERELAARFGLTRASVRRWLDDLERTGQVTRHVGRGTFLVPEVAPDPVLTSPAEIMAVRLLLEPQMLGLAVANATAADIDEMRHCLKEGETAAGFEEFEVWDSRLHVAFASATHNRLLIRLFTTMNEARDHPLWGSAKRRSFTPNAVPNTSWTTRNSSPPSMIGTPTQRLRSCAGTCCASAGHCSAATADRREAQPPSAATRSPPAEATCVTSPEYASSLSRPRVSWGSPAYGAGCGAIPRDFVNHDKGRAYRPDQWFGGRRDRPMVGTDGRTQRGRKLPERQHVRGEFVMAQPNRVRSASTRSVVPAIANSMASVCAAGSA